jgi:hypothetical protein
MLTDPIEDVDSVSPVVHPRSSLWLIHLFFRPRAFFSSFEQMDNRFTVCYATYVVGVAEAVSRISEELMKADLGGRSRLPEDVLGSWVVYWQWCLGVGLLSAVALYLWGGWWYGKRLVACGVTELDKPLARRVYIYSSLVWALPVIVLTIGDSLRYSTPLIAEQNDSWLWLASIGTLCWSVFVSYRGARTLFDVVRWKVRVWFLVLPLMVYGGLIGGMVLVGFLAATNVIQIQPNLDNTIRRDTLLCEVEYPGNWWVEEDVDSTESTVYFDIEAPQDVIVAFKVTKEPPDAQEALEQMVGIYGQAFEGGESRSFTMWGALEGIGVKRRAKYSDGTYFLSIFSSNNKGTNVTVVEIVHVDAKATVEPGLEIVRNSFRLKE